jgi:predicted amino acid racemase
MAELIINTRKIVKNIKKLNSYLSLYNIKWSLIVKVLSGNEALLEKILREPLIEELHSIGDTRLSNLRKIRMIKPDIVTMYIKPPSTRYTSSVVEFADISFNTNYTTIVSLNEEAKRQRKLHKIIIMIEMGELREGVMGENLVEFYSKVFKLSNIRVIGIGTNLGCMYGIEPTYDKLVQLSLYKQLLEAKFRKTIPLISGGSSITLPLVGTGKRPKAVNHFRIGEAVFLGTSPLNNKKFRNLSNDAFNFRANILELEKKVTTPIGKTSDSRVGRVAEMSETNTPQKSYRAVLDFGILDVDSSSLTPKNENAKFAGITSDMTVFDLGSNKMHTDRIKKYKEGGKIHFKPNYMAVARLMNSKFIEKIVH